MHFVAAIILIVLLMINQLIASDYIALLPKINMVPAKMEADQCRRPHADSSFLYVIWLGRGLIVYRLFPGWPTFLLKYIHAGLAVFAFFVQTSLIYTMNAGKVCLAPHFDDEYKTGTDNNKIYNRMHVKLATTAAIWGMWQIGTGIFVFMIMPQSARRAFARFHATMGIFLYMFLCLLSMARLLEDQFGQYMPIDPRYDCTVLNVEIFFYTMIVVTVLIVPYFEWPTISWI